MTKKISVTIFSLILSCFALTSLAAEIRVTTDRSSVKMNESFQVIFSASEKPNDEPDFSPLQKDFEILSQGQSNQRLMVNGSFSSNIQWVVDVIAKKTGVLTIPEINFGRDKSKASSVLISKEEQTTLSIKGGKGGGDLFFLVDVSTKTPYVQQQVIYTLRLYRRVNLSQAELTNPKLADAMIERLGEDKKYNTQFQGSQYTVTERKYAIFPQKSGAKTIAPLTLTANVVVGNRQSSGFSGFFNRMRTQTKRVVSNAVELRVRPVPSSFTGKHWLPAEQLHLQEEWSNEDLQVNVGEPLTRTLTLLVNGATVGQLPELSQSAVNGGLRHYRDQPLLKDQAREDSMIALREEKIALIPSQAGTYQLPEIELPWWNTKTDRMEIAKISAKTIQASALPGAAKAKPPPASTDATAPAQQGSADSAQQEYAWMGLSAFLGLGWLLTTLYLLIGRQKIIKPKKNNQISKPVDDGVNALKKACQKNNAIAAKDALIRWGQQQYGISSLGEIATLSSADLKEEILDLNQLLYSKNDSQWDGKKLWQFFKEQKSKVKKVKPIDNKLEPLYRI
jgi:hypothetical protein